MTFTDIVTAVQNRLNLTSTDSATRIGNTINDRYKRVTSSLGLNVTRRTTVQANASIGIVTLAFSGVEKLINVVDRSTTPYRVLKEITVEELRAKQPSSNTFPSYYCIVGMGSSTVTIEFDCVPAAAFTLYADGEANATTLSGTQIPAFSESFHDILVHGVLADEYRKMQKLDLAKDSEMLYMARLSDLRMWIAKSAYVDIYQGKRRGGQAVSGVPGAGGATSTNGATNYTQTGLITFDRTSAALGLRYPFAVAVGSEKVANLDADLLDGKDWLTVGALPDAGLGLTDVTTNNVTSVKHGFAPKSPADATKFLNGAATPAYAQVKGSDLVLADVVTNDVTSTAHGFAPKSPGDATKFLNGGATPAWSVPPAPTVNPGICEGRLTLTTALPVTSADVTAAGTVYFTPYGGNLISTYSGSAWSTSTFTEKTLTVPAVGNQMYDVFIVDSTLALEALAWTNDTTRATALVLQDGVWVKSGATTRRYLGSFRTLTASQTEDSANKRLLWNYYNRVPRPMVRQETAGTWAYTTAVFRQANANTANQLAVVTGVVESPVEIYLAGNARNSANNVQVEVGVGVDSTTTVVASSLSPVIHALGAAAAATYVAPNAAYRAASLLGYHFYAWLEFSEAAGVTTWIGSTSSGIFGTVQA